MEIYMEIWKPIPNAPHHEVSNFGNVRSKNFVSLVRCRWGGVVQRRHQGKILKPAKTGNYLGIRFALKGTNFYVHRLVAAAFLGQREHLYVNHKDGNKFNNHIDNLEWVTPSENMLHSTHVLGNKKGQFQKGCRAS